jgi:hypothetical protein
MPGRLRVLSVDAGELLAREEEIMKKYRLTLCFVLLFLMSFFVFNELSAQTNGKPAALRSDRSTASPADKHSPGKSNAETSATDGIAKIEFNQTTYDFGKQVGIDELKHSFSFKNTGDGTLIITNIKAG